MRRRRASRKTTQRLLGWSVSCTVFGHSRESHVFQKHGGMREVHEEGRLVDMAYEATEFYKPQTRRGSDVIVHWLRTARRLIIPVIGLLVVLIWADFASTTPVTWFDPYFNVSDPRFLPGAWLTGGHLILALMFLALNLTNRRYGPGVTTGQISVAWVLMGALAYYLFFYAEQPLTAEPPPPARISASFIGALLFAQFTAINVFNWTRGHPWWRAPLYAALWGSGAFCFTFYPSANYGLGAPWVNQMITHFGFLSAAAFLLLIPYRALRQAIKPLPGFGGA